MNTIEIKDLDNGDENDERRKSQISLLPMYMGKRNSEVRLTKIPLVVYATWLVVAVIVSFEEKIKLLQAKATEISRMARQDNDHVDSSRTLNSGKSPSNRSNRE